MSQVQAELKECRGPEMWRTEPVWLTCEGACVWEDEESWLHYMTRHWFVGRSQVIKRGKIIAHELLYRCAGCNWQRRWGFEEDK